MERPTEAKQHVQQLLNVGRPVQVPIGARFVAGAGQMGQQGLPHPGKGRCLLSRLCRWQWEAIQDAIGLSRCPRRLLRGGGALPATGPDACTTAHAPGD